MVAVVNDMLLEERYSVVFDVHRQLRQGQVCSAKSCSATGGTRTLVIVHQCRFLFVADMIDEDGCDVFGQSLVTSEENFKCPHCDRNILSSR